MCLWIRAIVIKGNQGLFVLNIQNVMNKNTFSYAYMIDSTFLIYSYNLWHARLGHMSLSYVKNM